MAEKNPGPTGRIKLLMQKREIRYTEEIYDVRFTLSAILHDK